MRTKIIFLRWFDLFLLSILLFGIPFLSSSLGYIDLISGQNTVDEMLTIDPREHYEMILFECVSLVIAFIYLKIRNFDFKRLSIQPSWTALGQAIIIFLIGTISMDVFMLLSNLFLPPVADETQINSTLIVPWWGFSSILFSLINGFYEEIFFLGLCLTVKPEHIKWVLIYSLFVRFSFHTYQGMQVALGIGFVYGLLMYLMYTRLKPRNLFPFFIAHSIADVFGLGLLSYFSFH